MYDVGRGRRGVQGVESLEGMTPGVRDQRILYIGTSMPITATRPQTIAALANRYP
jgi:hypothetical protein